MRAPKQGRKRPSGWLARIAAADAFGVTERGFDSCIRPLAPADCVRGAGKDLRFYVRGIIEAWSDRRVEAVAVKMAGGDPLLAGGSSSPALERYRDESAKLKRLDRLERQGRLVDLEIFNPHLDNVLTHLRRACERLETECGLRAREVYEVALNEAVATANRHFPIPKTEKEREQNLYGPEGTPDPDSGSGRAAAQKRDPAKARKRPAPARRQSMPGDAVVAGRDRSENRSRKER